MAGILPTNFGRGVGQGVERARFAGAGLANEANQGIARHVWSKEERYVIQALKSKERSSIDPDSNSATHALHRRRTSLAGQAFPPPVISDKR